MKAPRLLKKYIQVFGHTPEIIASAPGRINIIGEHTDYNLGYVLPAAVGFRVWFAAGKGKKNRVVLRALNFGEEDTFTVDSLEKEAGPRWSAYPKGILWILGEEGFPTEAFNGLIWGDVPRGAGLSSSAAVEAAVLSGLNALWGLGIPSKKMAKMAQKAENEFVGVRCGIMDQFVSFLAEPGRALFLDCKTLEYEHIPAALKEKSLLFLIYDSGVQRELSSSEYNKRRRESAAALEVLKRGSGVQAYREATMDLLVKSADKMDDLLFRRARHVISENGRVKQAAGFLRENHFERLGELLLQSHRSLRDDYQVSCPELDLFYEAAREYAGCLGGRMTGAGFGGSGIALMKSGTVEKFEAEIIDESSKRGYARPRFYLAGIGKGASVYRVKNSNP